MNQLSINSADWERLKIKLKRKYRDLTDSDLSYTLGSEQQLIEQLAESKGLALQVLSSA
jgi:hypothetical protein